MMKRRVFLIVLDSFGIGYLPDAEDFGDSGSNTLASISASEYYLTPNMERLGLFNIEGIRVKKGVEKPLAAYGRMKERSRGKDTTVGHWEIAGLISESPLPVYPTGFPEEVIKEFSRQIGRGVLCNLPYSGTEVIADYGREHMKTGKLIVYTSADSVFQIAAHEDVVSVPILYQYCEIARRLLVGEHGVGRVIARPFHGEYPFVRSAQRHDYSLLPPGETMLDVLMDNSLDTISVGKIYDIFAGKGIGQSFPTRNNTEGIEYMLKMQETDFKGLCFINLVDFDMLYGHRNDVDGYAKAASEFDAALGDFMAKMGKEDILIITADHGCDPGFKGTDHTREYTPMLMFGGDVKSGVDLGTRNSFADIGKTILDIFDLNANIAGESYWSVIH
ncbi:MAG: phosphopentomutase [Lachnospiraceae bacterium]